MQNAVPKGEGGMLAVLGSTIDKIEKILNENKEKFKTEIANDNSEGQLVLSGKNNEIDKLIEVLKSNNIKNKICVCLIRQKRILFLIYRAVVHLYKPATQW